MIVFPYAHSIVTIYTIDSCNPDIAVLIFTDGIDTVIRQTVIDSDVPEFQLGMHINIILRPDFHLNKKELQEQKK